MTTYLTCVAILAAGVGAVSDPIDFAIWSPRAKPDDSGWQFHNRSRGIQPECDAKLLALDEALVLQPDLKPILEAVDYESKAERAFIRKSDGAWREVAIDS